MGSDRERFERAIDDAYREQTGLSLSERGDVANQVIKRGRRRRAGRAMGALAMVLVLATGAFATVDTLSLDVKEMDPADTAELGAERVLEFGGPLAGFGDHLFIADGKLSNDAGDKSSIATFDVRTGEVTDSPPVSATGAVNLAAGPEGLWLVAWSGDMPVGGAGGDVNGTIQLVDPVSGKLIHDLPRPDSAPYDVAIDARFAESAWVVDSARHELLGLDARSGATGKVIELDRGPTTVAASPDAVWVGANPKRNASGALYRWDLHGGTLETFPVDHCLNDLYVLNDAVWAVDYCGGALHAFDATSGEKVSTVRIGGQPSAMAFADGDFWVTSGSEVVRIDPSSARVVGEPVFVAEGVEHIAALGDTVYVSSWEGVFRLGEDAPIREPKPTPQEEQEPPPGGTSAQGCDQDGVTCIPLDRPMAEVATGFGSAWVANVGEGDTFGIARFDSESGDETARLRTDGFTKAMAPDADHMWVVLEQGDGSVVQRIDPATTEVVDSYEIGASGNIGQPSLAVGAGFVWVSGPNGSVTRVAISTGRSATKSYADELPRYGIDSGPLRLAYGDGHLWLSYGQGHVGMADPATGELIRVDRDALAINAYDIVHAAGQLWSPHQTVKGRNVVSYTSTSDPGDGGEVELPAANPVAMAGDENDIWVLQDSFEEDEPDRLQVIDPLARRVVGAGLSIDLGFGGDVTVGEGYVWVAGHNVLYRIEPGVAL